MPKILAVGSKVETGDRLETPNFSFVRIRFGDTSELILGPDAALVIDAVKFDVNQPDQNSAVFTLIKGGLRSAVSSPIPRGAQRYWLNTPAGRIDMANATFLAHVRPLANEAAVSSRPYLLASSAAMSPTPVAVDAGQSGMGIFPLQIAQNSGPQLQSSGMLSGLYVHVIDGAINLSNRGGTQQFSAGQFGFSGSVVSPPIIVPNNPGIQFNPPPVFSATSALGSPTGGTGTKANTVDCEVR